MDEWEIQRKGAAFTGNAAYADFAPEEPRQFATDGEPEPGAPILAAGCSVSLLERFENDPLLVGRDPDPGVGHGKCSDLFRHAKQRVPRGPA
ncbi:hypothetical protein D3C83_34480 [compost metagenome]